MDAFVEYHVDDQELLRRIMEDLIPEYLWVGSNARFVGQPPESIANQILFGTVQARSVRIVELKDGWTENGEWREPLLPE